MAKKTYIGINGAAKNVTKLYVGVNDQAKKVLKGYVGDSNGQARLFYDGGGSPTPPPTPGIVFAGRTIYRHPQDYGTVIEYDEFGTSKKLLVSDVRYRMAVPFEPYYGGQGLVPGLNSWQHFYYPINPTNAIDNKSTATPLYGVDSANFYLYQNQLTDAYFQAALAPTLGPVIQSAKVATDALAAIKSRAALHCRAVTVGGLEWQLPNIYQLFVIYASGDVIDSLDPELNSGINRNLAVGKFPPNTDRFPCSSFYSAWSSTQYDANNAVYFDNYCGSYYGDKNDFKLVIPVVEI